MRLVPQATSLTLDYLHHTTAPFIPQPEFSGHGPPKKTQYTRTIVVSLIVNLLLRECLAV